MTTPSLDIYCSSIIPDHSDGKHSVDVVFEGSRVLAFNHPGPLWPVHIVVIPKPHIGSLLELGEFAITATALLRAVADIAKDISQQHGASRVVTNLGKYQDVDHLAFHVSYGEPLAQDT